VTGDEEYATWTKLFADNIQKNGIMFPSIDLFFTLPSNIQNKAAAAVAVLTHIKHRDSHQPAFQEIHVFAPKGAVPHAHLVVDIKDRNQSRSNVHLWELEQLSVSSVLDRMVQCPKRSAIVILQGALYISDDVEPAPIKPNAKFALSEDLWAPQLHRFIQNIEEVNADAECYVIVDAGESYPVRSELQAPYMSLESLAIIVDEGMTRKNEVLAQNLAQWTQMLESGRIGSALQSIEALPQEFDRDKPHLRVQLLHSAGMAGHALDEIEKLDMSKATVEATLKIARIASEAGGLPKSRAILESALPHLISVSNYETALAIASILGSDSLQRQIDAQYRARYPAQSTQRRRNIQSLISSGLFEEAVGASDTSEVSQDTRAALEFCRIHLPVTGVPDYAWAVRDLKSKDGWAQTAFVWIVNDALRRHLPVHAFELVFGASQPQGIQPIGKHAFIVMRKLMLAIDSKGNFPVAEDSVSAAFRELIRYVAERPAQPTWRFEIENLLSHKMAGKKGLALLLYQIMQASSPTIISRPNQDLPTSDKQAVEEALSSLLERLAQEGTVVTGRLIFPSDFFADGVADELVSVSRAAIEQIATDSLATDSSVNDVLLWLSIASLAAPQSTYPNADLELYRQAAGRLATTGHQQQARNLIDLVLLGAESADPIRRRETWFVCADIYSRLSQNHQGLVAVACGLSTEALIDLESAQREADVCTRLVRDAGVPEYASVFHKRSGELLHQMQQYDSQAIVHEYMGFTIEFKILSRGPINREALIDLINRMQLNAQEVLARNAPPQPMALLLGQAIQIAERENIAVSVEAKDVCRLLGSRLSGHEAILYQQIATSQATTSGLLKLLQTAEPARYARDAAFDSGRIATGARRLLAGAQFNGSDTIFALELLSDRGMPLPGWQTTARPAPQPATTVEPGNWAIELSRRDIDVVIIGLDEQGCAHAVLARQGRLLSSKRLDEEFSTQGFLQWIKHYPYRYGIDEETLNLFHVSTEGFNFPFDLERATAIVAGNRLQQLPPTLYRVEDQFVGQIQPVFSAPSLSWLYAASSSPASTDKRLTGWISIADQQGQTLVFAKERLEETIEKHGIELNTGTDLPDGFWGAEMSLVVAHGSVLPEGKYFQRVSDEGTLRVTTEDFARAFKNVGVVVLFVCSAGRADKSPEGESTYGLARELLEQGCSTVIASPWPLDSRVPYHWFPSFMDTWSSGKSVATATFLANQYVEKHFNSNFANCLAMTVFGDGLRLRMR
jgi:hypothetical protein